MKTAVTTSPLTQNLRDLLDALNVPSPVHFQGICPLNLISLQGSLDRKAFKETLKSLSLLEKLFDHPKVSEEINAPKWISGEILGVTKKGDFICAIQFGPLGDETRQEITVLPKSAFTHWNCIYGKSDNFRGRRFEIEPRKSKTIESVIHDPKTKLSSVGKFIEMGVELLSSVSRYRDINKPPRFQWNQSESKQLERFSRLLSKPSVAEFIVLSSKAISAPLSNDFIESFRALVGNILTNDTPSRASLRNLYHHLKRLNLSCFRSGVEPCVEGKFNRHSIETGRLRPEIYFLPGEKK